MIIENNKSDNDISMIEEERSKERAFEMPDYSINPALLTQVAYSSTQNAQDSSLPIVNITETQAVPTDEWTVSGGAEQWHHLGEYSLNTIPVWNDYTGEGVLVAVMDDGFNYNHSELSANYRTDLDRDVLDDDNDALNDFGDNHGTHVSLVIAADDNGAYGAGVAFDSDILGVKRGFNGQGTIDDIIEGFEHVLASGADIMNNSWGINAAFGDNKKIDFIGTDTADVVNQFQNLVENGRDGLGINIVFSAGNSRAQGSSANYKNYQNSPYTITVGAIEQDGTFAYFSEAGSNLLVTAPGDSIRVSTATDNGGASFVSGTSFSAPAVSGVISLMLEANPDLGYRDVQEILALSGRQVDADGIGWANEGWQINGANNFNGGGMHFSHDYGYGNVDALAAVRLAESWGEQKTFSNLSVIDPVSVAPALAIPEQGTITTTITITEDISIEHILIDLDIDHEKAGDLVVTLTSPDGTDSVLMHHVSNGAFTTAYGIYNGVNFEFSSAAHWGESSLGTWTLTVADETAGNAGTLNNWSLSFLGSEQSDDDTYFYTNEYTGAGALTDSAGVDTINAVAVTNNSTINLETGVGTINGEAFSIANGTVIENVLTGDGDDLITASVADNTLNGGRGDDTVTYSFDIADFLIDLVDSATVVLEHAFQSFTDTLISIENFIFNDSTYTRSELDAYVANGGGQGEFFETELALVLDSGAFGLLNNETGDFTYKGVDLGGDNQNDFLNVTRTNSGISAGLTAIGQLATETVALKNNDVTDIELTGFGVVLVDQRSAEDGSTILVRNSNGGRILAGAGNDEITIQIDGQMTEAVNANHNWVVKAGAGNDQVAILGASLQYHKIYLGAGDDMASMWDGNDRVYGDAGDDIIFLQDGNDFADGGDDNDYINAGAGDDHIKGGAGDDDILGGDGKDVLEGGSGNDDIEGGNSNDQLFGNGGNDFLKGQEGKDFIRGGDGHDDLRGGAGRDTLYGDAGDDAIEGGDDADFIRGGVGGDVLEGESGNDKLYGDAGDDELDGGDGFDALYGGNGDDIMFGGTDNDRLYGQNDNDYLDGGVGDDIVSAGAGMDIMIGGDGADRLYGGSGQDTFALTVLDASAERFYRFTLGEDIINITDILSGYDHGVDDINDFVKVLDMGNGNTDLRINADGDVGGTYGRAALIFNDFGGASADDLLANGTLIANVSV